VNAHEQTSQPEPSTPTRAAVDWNASDASGVEICAYPMCRQPFTPRRRWQRFCKPEHRAAHHAASDDSGVRGVVKSNKLLKGGKRSLTLHFDADQDAVLHLEPGKVVEVLKP
jgi:hypothetical protein